MSHPTKSEVEILHEENKNLKAKNKAAWDIIRRMEQDHKELLNAQTVWPQALQYLIELNPFNVIKTEHTIHEGLVTVTVRPGFKSYSFRNGDMGCEVVDFDKVEVFK